LIFVAIAFIYLVRLFSIQVINDDYKLNAENNVLRYVTIYPDRGMVFDRHNIALVENEISYDLKVTPRLVDELDTLELANILEVDVEALVEKLNKAKKYSRYKASVIEKELSKKTYARLQEKFFKYPGFHIERRTVRKYPEAIGAHIVGYIGEVNARITEKDPYYKPGDYIGISGIEKAYEEELRGKRGLKVLMVDVHNRTKGSFKEGKYDTVAVAGKDLYTSIDAELQTYGEQLMQNKIGSVVAIEPKTGEILAMVSSPTYDPNGFVGRDFSETYVKLSKDPFKPLLNRALIAQYPPGSTFKLVNALIGQQMGVLRANTSYGCRMGFHAAGLSVGCHAHASPLKLAPSIQHSCNAYYCYAFWDMIDHSGFENTEQAYQKWREQVVSFGFGKRFDDDFVSERNGFIPKSTYYDKYYGRHRWKALTIISLSIGQGEILVTPMQLANLSAIIANKGYYYTPHLVRAVGEGKKEIAKFTEKHFTAVDPKYYEEVIKGMELVFTDGTARMSLHDSIPMAGKTGTAQNPHGDDHSIFIMFAPADDPKIAISVIVENGGYGSTWAAPIASLMAEKYLTDSIVPKRKWLEKRILEGNLLEKLEIKEEE